MIGALNLSKNTHTSDSSTQQWTLSVGFVFRHYPKPNIAATVIHSPSLTTFLISFHFLPRREPPLLRRRYLLIIHTYPYIHTYTASLRPSRSISISLYYVETNNFIIFLEKKEKANDVVLLRSILLIFLEKKRKRRTQCFEIFRDKSEIFYLRQTLYMHV